jgi:hypothetical protein
LVQNFQERENILRAVARLRVPKLALTYCPILKANHAEAFAEELVRNDRMRVLKMALMGSCPEVTRQFCLKVLTLARTNSTMERMRFAAHPSRMDSLQTDVTDGIRNALLNGGWPELRSLENWLISCKTGACNQTFDWNAHPKLLRNDFFTPNIEPQRYARWKAISTGESKRLDQMCWRLLPFATKIALQPALDQ